MALIKCPECGKEISDKARMCIQCGYPLDNTDKIIGELIIKSQPNPPDTLEKSLTFDILTTSGEVLCTIEPGRVKKIPVHSDMEIYAKPTYRWNKENSKTDKIYVKADKTTRVQLTHIRVMLGLGVKTVLNYIDVIDSD